MEDYQKILYNLMNLLEKMKNIKEKIDEDINDEFMQKKAKYIIDNKLNADGQLNYGKYSYKIRINLKNIKLHAKRANLDYRIYKQAVLWNEIGSLNFVTFIYKNSSFQNLHNVKIIELFGELASYDYLHSSVSDNWTQMNLKKNIGYLLDFYRFTQYQNFSTQYKNYSFIQEAIQNIQYTFYTNEIDSLDMAKLSTSKEYINRSKRLLEDSVFYNKKIIDYLIYLNNYVDKHMLDFDKIQDLKILYENSYQFLEAYKEYINVNFLKENSLNCEDIPKYYIP